MLQDHDLSLIIIRSCERLNITIKNLNHAFDSKTNEMWFDAVGSATPICLLMWQCCSFSGSDVLDVLCWAARPILWTWRDDSVSPVLPEPCRAQSSLIHTNNLFRLKMGASCVSTVSFFETSYAPHWSIHNEAYVVYAFGQTHHFSTFTAWTGRLAGASASCGRHTALIGWVSTTLRRIHG